MKNLVVIIDNGHGKNTPGKCAPDKSLFEWQWTREIAAMLCMRLYGINTIQTVILVPEENDISLKERVRRVNTIVHDAKIAGKEVLLISIHINAAGHGTWKTASGWSVWVANNASEKSKLFAQIAAVLTENMFMDNQEDVQFLNSEKGKEMIVKLHYNAILKYIEKV